MWSQAQSVAPTSSAGAPTSATAMHFVNGSTLATHLWIPGSACPCTGNKATRKTTAALPRIASSPCNPCRKEFELAAILTAAVMYSTAARCFLTPAAFPQMAGGSDPDCNVGSAASSALELPARSARRSHPTCDLLLGRRRHREKNRSTRRQQNLCVKCSRLLRRADTRQNCLVSSHTGRCEYGSRSGRSGRFAGPRRGACNPDVMDLG
jgi:hypothetical protein